MSEPIQAYKTDDGILFETKVEAELHEFKTLFSKVAADHNKNIGNYHSLDRVKKVDFDLIRDLWNKTSNIKDLILESENPEDR